MDDVLILGAGVTGLSLADELSGRGWKVTVVERNPHVGGLAATLSRDGARFDLGSHRIHSDTGRETMAYLEGVLGEGLLRRPRRGRFHFMGSYIRYPPNAASILREFRLIDLAKFGLSYLAGMASDGGSADNFEDVMVSRVGRRAYESFYRDFAVKLWGRSPRNISPEVGRRSRFLGGMQFLSKVLLRDKSVYYYPRQGIGEICERLAARVEAAGGRVFLSSKVVGLRVADGGVAGVEVAHPEGKTSVLKASVVVSTLPVDDLYRMAYPADDAPSLDWRGVRILYLLLADDIGKEPETYYFPGTDVLFGRVSQIMKYSPNMGPRHGTLLTVEVPSSEGEDTWEMPEEELVRVCVNQLLKVKVLDAEPKILGHFSLRVEKAYPIYTLGWSVKFERMHSRLNALENLFLIGRGALFLHCNIDHSLAQAKRLSAFLSEGRASCKEAWAAAASKLMSVSARD